MSSPERKVFGSIEEYVKEKGGKRVIRRVLVANNGIAAVKGIRSMQKWAYETFGSEKTFEFIAMATPEDIKVNAEYIKLADEMVEVPGGSNNNNYANVSLIIAIAQRKQCDAVWAGWGHASENPRLPDGLAEYNRKNKHQIVWIGPPSSAMRALGDKIGSTLIAQSAGVPCTGWSGSGLVVENKDRTGTIPDDIYDKACVHNAKEALEVCAKVGFPVMIKASEGGGGKGIRMCHKPEEVKARYSQVVGEVPGSPVFIMKLAHTCRHLEVQLLGDEHGEAIAVLGRDCSIQRRHQKIIEEGPVLAAKPPIWRKMEQSAVQLAKAVGYVGAGTVEYLYTQQDTYFFLELNPRLQVEHPVTELISGVNLPAAQLQIAMGLPLCSIPQIRRFYGRDPVGTDKIDFDRTLPVVQPMHVIACRITAENPEMEFQPTSGSIEHLNFRSTPNVWGYFSVSSLGGVHQFADSQFGHLFAKAKTREEARRNMVQALKELEIQGDIRTTVEYLGRILETQDFIDNQVSTEWLEGAMRSKAIGAGSKLAAPLVVSLASIFRAATASAAAMSESLDALGRGQIPAPSAIQTLTESDVELIYKGIKYSVSVARSGPKNYELSIPGWNAGVEVHCLADKGLLCLVDGKRYIVYGNEQPDGLRLTIDSKTYMFTREYDPTRLIAEMQGKLVRYTVPDGGHVKKGAAFAEMEVMKMYIALSAPEDGILRHSKPEGAVLEGGDLIARLELDDPTSVSVAAAFDGSFPALKPPRALGDKPDVNLDDAVQTLNNVLDGYKLSAKARASALQTAMSCLRDPRLPICQFETLVSAISAKIPPKLMASMRASVSEYEKTITQPAFHWEAKATFPSETIQDAITTHTQLLQQDEISALNAVLGPLREFLALYKDGNQSHCVYVLSSLLDKFCDVESNFTGSNSETAIKTLRRKNLKNLSMVATYARCNYMRADRTALVTDIIKNLTGSLRPLLERFEPILKRVSTLIGPGQTRVAILARRSLLSLSEASFADRTREVETLLRSIVKSTSQNYSESDFQERAESLRELIKNPGKDMEALLIENMANRDTSVRVAAMEAFLLRNRQAYSLRAMDTSTKLGFLLSTFKSTLTADGKTRNIYRDIEASAKRESLPSSVDVTGTIAYFPDPSKLADGLAVVFSAAGVGGGPGSSEGKSVGTVYLIVRSDEKDDANASAAARNYLNSNVEQLSKMGVARVTLIVAYRSQRPRYFTFREASGYSEDKLVRHLRPSLALHIDLGRMEAFRVKLMQTVGPIKVLEAVPREGLRARDRYGYDGRRLFVRRVVSHFSKRDLITGAPDAKEGARVVAADALLDSLLSALDLAAEGDLSRYRNNNIGIVVPSVLSGVSPADLAKHLRAVAMRSLTKIRQLRVHTVELSCTIAPEGYEAARSPKRASAARAADLKTEKVLIVAENPSGFRPEVRQYIIRDGLYREVNAGAKVASGGLDGKSTDTPYPVTLPLEKQRNAGMRVGAAYAYDYLAIFEVAIANAWAESGMKPPRGAPLVEARELVLDGGVDTEKLKEVKRPFGQNKVAMLAWQMTIRTPRYPSGREIILIANDIAVKIGSFGVLEDRLFYLASRRSRRLGIPRLYFSVNSGARIGLASELMTKFRVAWVQNETLKGPEYLYLTPSDYKELTASVKAEKITVPAAGGAKEVRYKITDIIGAENGIGVENLSGSGLIAGETSKAYNEVFTLTYCCGRCVGIGAYLARLGQRVIQKREGAPILLTGYFALNKLLGRLVYTSNDQLGGIDVMHANGVTHMTCSDDLDGVQQCLEWLSYVPAVKGVPAAIAQPSTLSDPVSREIKFAPPSSGVYDPRLLITGANAGGLPEPRGAATTGDWASGFFDRGSFVELMSGWAKTVVCGRARLGGMPVGVIAVTTASVEQIQPADPATPDSKEIVQQKAGQVWYPDSAFKTAQAIRDMEREGLPLIIFANWRGFSGGQRDMFDEVLKYGSDIVDALVDYTQPVSVYLPPQATLRGGAWVVLDSQINPPFIQMFADPNARGGILEVEGTLGIKFRRKQELATSYRLDPTLQTLRSQLDVAEKESADKTASENDSGNSRRDLLHKLRSREQKILPAYHQASALFVDLHDTPGRMKTKGVIEAIVPWRKARTYFYYSIRWRVALRDMAAKLRSVDPALSWTDATAAVKNAIRKTKGDAAYAKAMSAGGKTALAFIESCAAAVDAAVPAVRRAGLRRALVASKTVSAQGNDEKSAGSDSVGDVCDLIKGLALDSNEMKKLKAWLGSQ